MTEFVTLTRTWTAAALKGAVKVSSEFEDQGFCSTFQDFNDQLVRPFRRFEEANAQAMCSEISWRCCGLVCRDVCYRALRSLPNPFRPTNVASRQAKFILWNVLCFWIGVLDLIVIFALKSELSSWWAWAIALVDGLLGYLFAYTFYFTFVAYGKLRWMMWGLALVLAYVCATAYLTYEGLTGPGNHVEAIEGALNGCKALANAIVLYHAAKIVYKEHLGGTHLAAGRVRYSQFEDEAPAAAAAPAADAEVPVTAAAAQSADAEAPAPPVPGATMV